MNLPETAQGKITRSNGQININVMSGTDVKPNYINYDWNPKSPEVDIVDNALNIWQYFDNGTVDNVIFFQALEHFSRADALKILNILCALLKPSGKIHIRIPDLEGLVDEYHRKHITADHLFYILYGGQQKYDGIDPYSDFHKCGFTEGSIKTELERNGMRVEEINHVFGVGLLHIVAYKEAKNA